MPANEEYLRSPKLMHRVFCGSALLLLLTTTTMMTGTITNTANTIHAL